MSNTERFTSPYTKRKSSINSFHSSLLHDSRQKDKLKSELDGFKHKVPLSSYLVV